MKKITMIGLTILLLTVLCSCTGGGKSVPESPTTAGAVTKPAEEASVPTAMYFCRNGVNIALDMPMADLLDALPQANHYTEQTSCAFEGLDKTFDYGSFVIQTYPKDGQDFVFGFWFMDDTVETSDGVYIGMTAEEVAAVYGEDTFNGENAYIVESSNHRMTIMIQDDIVNSIQYTIVI